MDTNPKRKIAAILTGIGCACLTAAGILSAREYLTSGHSQALLADMRQKAALAATAEAGGRGRVIAAHLEALLQKGRGAALLASASFPDAKAKEPPKEPNPYADSFLANGDMAAWLVIPGTNVDYPVMWTPRDEEYYLRRGFDGRADENGCLILDTDSSLSPITTNLIIHGHNMDSGAMFGRLANYESEDFYREHKRMILHTEKYQKNYEVIAVFRSQVYRRLDQVFKFYKFFQANTQEEFDDFYQNIMALSLYDTGVTAEFGDTFLTLSTCSYHVEQGRFVVVAKATDIGRYYEPIPRENDRSKQEEEVPS